MRFARTRRARTDRLIMDTDISELIEKNFTSAQLTTLQVQFIHTTIFNNSSKKKPNPIKKKKKKI